MTGTGYVGPRQRELLAKVVDGGGLRMPKGAKDRACAESLARKGLVRIREGEWILPSPEGWKLDDARRGAAQLTFTCGLCGQGYPTEKDKRQCEAKCCPGSSPPARTKKKRNRPKRRCVAKGCKKEFDTIREANECLQTHW